MAYPKRSAPTTKRNQPLSSNRLPQDKKERLLAIQQKEEFKGLLVTKFLSKYGNNKNVSNRAIENEISQFMKNEPLTQDNLRKLEERVRDGNIGKNSQAGNNNRKPSREATVSNNGQIAGQYSSQHLDQKSQDTASYAKGYDSQPLVDPRSKPQYDDDDISIRNDRPRSVYEPANEGDEWAVLLKADYEEYRRQRENEKKKQLEQRNKVRNLLEEQLHEREQAKRHEKEEIQDYMKVVKQQMNNYDQKEKKKKDELQQKIMAEKQMRDKQLHDEMVRRKKEKIEEKKKDDALLSQIRAELRKQAEDAQKKKLDQKEFLKKVLKENEENRKIAEEQARREREADIKAQQEYTRLIEKQEADRAAEMKAREDRAKRFMSMMADTVVRNQKEQMVEEERKLLEATLAREKKEMEEERARQSRLNEQKKDIRHFLDDQLRRKELSKKEEKELERRQAETWKRENAEYFTNQKQKQDKIMEVNKKNQEFLRKQMEEEKWRKQRRMMNTEELLLNKSRLKEIAMKDSDHFKKMEVTPTKNIKMY